MVNWVRVWVEMGRVWNRAWLKEEEEDVTMDEGVDERGKM